jgi:tetratricopeptide (TPR) repeat protein
LYSLYGRARLTDGDPAAGKEAFLKELESNPTDFDANLHLGSLYRLEKEYGKARVYLDKARQIRPKALEAQYQIASLEFGVGNVAEAAKLLEEVVADAPKFVEGHITLATVYYRQKRKADGDRERAIVDKLNSETQSKELRTQ